MNKKDKKQVETLKEEQDNLEKKVEALQLETAQKLYNIKLPEGAKTLSSILKTLGSVKWNHKSAPGIVELHDTLSSFKKSQTLKDKIELPAYLLHVFYETLLAREDSGIAGAKSHMTLIKHIGSDVASAMDIIGKENDKIREIHIRLNEIDTALTELTKDEKSDGEVV